MPMSQSEDAWTTYSGATSLSRAEFDGLVWNARNARGRNRRAESFARIKVNYTGTWSDVETLVRDAVESSKLSGYPS